MCAPCSARLNNETSLFSLPAPSSCLSSRLTLTKFYDGGELNTEYFFGPFASEVNSSDSSPTGNLFGYPTSFEIYEFASSCDQYSVSYLGNSSLPGMQNIMSFEADLWIKLNEKKKKAQYDDSFKRWPLVIEYTMKMAYLQLTDTTMPIVV